MNWFDKFKGNANDAEQDTIELRQGTAEFEWFTAKAELEQSGNLVHGASHLANLLTYDPAREEWLELLDEYLEAAAPNPESLFPESDEKYYGIEAIRAYIWYRNGEIDRAVQRMAAIANGVPENHYTEAWVLGWLEAAGGLDRIEDATAISLFANVMVRFSEAKQTPTKTLRDVRRWAHLCDRAMKRIVQNSPELASGPVMMTHAGFLRKAGRFDDAADLLAPTLAQNPDWHTATALGLIRRQQGNLTAAEEAFELALRLDPEDISARLETADTFFENDQWERALLWYENALASESVQPWALPSAMYCRWKVSGDDDLLQTLGEFHRDKPDNQRAHYLYWSAVSPGMREPVDAMANVLRKIRANILEGIHESGSRIRIRVSGLDVPSNHVAFHLEMESLSRDITLEVEVDESGIGKPDPRVPIKPVRYQLWKYGTDDTSTEAIPNVPQPADGVLNAIAKLAATSFNPTTNWAAASRVADELGTDRVVDLVGVMVHPPVVPKDSTSLQWLPRVQLAAAEVIGQLDEGWENSVRREALLSILFGPSDWTTRAAIDVLARIAVNEPANALDIHQAFETLAAHRPDRGFCCWEYKLHEEWLSNPILFDDEREQIEAKLNETFDNDDDSDA